MLEIDRQKVVNVFSEYTSRYNVRDIKIKLKVDHTYRVASLCERIARSLKLSTEELALAWLIGMLHDIGRFEQLRRFGTFSDAKSIDHARFGITLLFEENLLEEYLPTMKEETTVSDIIRTAIWNHSAYRIEEGLDKRTEMFCHILRDADKIDILKVSQDVSIEEIYNVTTEELLHSQVTPEVMGAFLERHAVLRSLKKTPVDHMVGHSALVFELVYPESYRIVKEQGYLDQILHFSSENGVTREQFEKLRACMEKYLEEKL